VKYRVAWTPIAQEHLASVWLSSPDRQAVTSAAAAIDADLVNDPQSQGESRSGALVHRVLAPTTEGSFADRIDGRQNG